MGERTQVWPNLRAFRPVAWVWAGNQKKSAYWSFLQWRGRKAWANLFFLGEALDQPESRWINGLHPSSGIETAKTLQLGEEWRCFHLFKQKSPYVVRS
jgi:hypothetical protein